ncbi:MAG: alpha/beta hydrolase [Mycobacterium sp.]
MTAVMAPSPSITPIPLSGSLPSSPAPAKTSPAGLTSYAHNGIDALDSFQAGLRASHNDTLAGGPSLNTAIGHRYDSTLVGAAGLDGHHLDANNVIAAGSPGVLADHASGLNLGPGAHFPQPARQRRSTVATT